MVRPGYAFSLTTAGVVRRADEAHVDAVPLAPFKQGGGYGQQGVGRWRTTFKLPRQGQTVEPIAARCCGQTERAGIWLGCRDLFYRPHLLEEVTVHLGASVALKVLLHTH